MIRLASRPEPLSLKWCRHTQSDTQAALGPPRTTWRGIRDRVAIRDRNVASTLDAAVSQLQAAASRHDAVNASAAAATITASGAAYSRQFP